MSKMKTFLAHILTLALMASLLPSLYGQEEEQPYRAYFFEGEEVVFEFDLKYFEKGTKDGTSKRLDFEDLDIYEVAVAGEFNNWSRKKWKMKKVGPNRYQLRKKITEFDDAFKWEFKFVVNGIYWAEPGEAVANKPERAYHQKFLKDTYNLELYTAKSDPDGNACFYLPGHTDARKVVLSGTFNNWDEEDFLMNREDGGWSVCLKLEAGRYEYKYLVDGEWINDPTNPNRTKNQYGTDNTVYYVTKPVTFRLEGYKNAKEVILAGSFNNWKTDAIKMKRQDGAWVAELNLSGGKHWYKFIVDGQWITDPDNPFKEHDGAGHINSVMIVR